MKAKRNLAEHDGGFHNADLAASAARILKGGSWKRQRTVAIIPAAEKIPTRVYLSHRNIITPPNQPCIWWAAEGMEVGEAYSQAIDGILSHPELSTWEYILTIEHDNIVPPDGLLRLMQRMEENKHLACIGGLYWTKGFGGQPQTWGDPRDPINNHRPQPPDPNGGLIEVCGTGMGFNLWRMSMFKDPKLRRPWFKTLTGLEGQGVATQDLYFWQDARKQGYRCAVDCSVKVGHFDADGAFGIKGHIW